MTALNPLPKYIRASAQDAGNASMRKGCRSAWDKDDYNAACDTQDRLIRSLYGLPSDGNQPDRCFIRFQIAEQLERAGKIDVHSDILGAVAEAMAA